MYHCTIRLLLSAILCGYFFSEIEAAKGVDYHFTGDWWKTHADCGQGTGTESQSPVDIVTANTKYTPYPPLNISYIHDLRHFKLAYWMDGGGFYLEDRTSFQVGGAGVPDAPVVAGGDYKLLQFHFHTASEHTLNGSPTVMEVHLVHTRSGIPHPLNTTGGLLVIGVMFELGPPNAWLADVLNKIESNHTVLDNATAGALGDEARLHSKQGLLMEVNHFEGLLPNDAMTNFYHYNGSLTTPPCYESVLWFVCGTKDTMSIEQFIRINRLQGVAAITNRPTQPLNSRIVTRSFLYPTTNPTTNPTTKPTNTTPTKPPIVCRSCSFVVVPFSASLYFLFSIFKIW